jgi:hypothetical protein
MITWADETGVTFPQNLRLVHMKIALMGDGS